MKFESGLVHKGSKGKAERMVKVASMKVDESGIWRQRYENNQKWLFESLGKISPKELNDAEKKLHEYSEKADEQGDAAGFDHAQDTIRVVRILGRIRAASTENRVKEIERLAKKEVFLLADVNHERLLDGPIRDAVYQLSTAVDGLAMLKFPDDLKRQEKAREESVREEILKKKAEMDKFNVS